MMFGANVLAEKAALKPFTSGSYQQILSNNANRPFMLVIWSIDCSSCLKDMGLLSSIHKDKPELKIIMLAMDDESATDQIEQILKKNSVLDLENWIFADSNTQKLRFEIDPKWYGEIPRTYFLNAEHGREGVSGVLTQKAYDALIKRMMN
jgi:thiol-disulfide isomerase/thioredoxin